MKEHPILETVVTVDNLRFPVRECGPGDGVPVLLLHGFPDSLRSFDAQLQALAADGYRAIAPALRGYAASAIPDDGDYFLVTLAGDLLGLMDVLEIPRAHLVGHDWGAAIGWVAVATSPQRFISFTSLAIPPPGGLARALGRYPLQARNSWYMAFFQVRGLADRAVTVRDFALLEKLWRDWSPGWNWPPEAFAQVKETFRQPGVVPAALGYYRALAEWLAAPNRRAQMLIRQPVEVPVMVMVGRRDGCMDPRLPLAAMRREQFRAGVKLEAVDSAGHFLHREQPVRVNELLLDFFAGHPH